MLRGPGRRICCPKVALYSLVFFLSHVAKGFAGQINFETYMFLEPGMSEAEVLMRAGRPDKEIYFDHEAQRTMESMKQLVYIPGPGESDPQLTIITIQKGKVLNLERTMLFSSPKRSQGGQIDLETYNLLAIGMSEGELLARAGTPDKEVYLGEEMEGPNQAVKQLHFIPKPDEPDPHLTIVTVKQGKVVNFKRTPIFFK